MFLVGTALTALNATGDPVKANIQENKQIKEFTEFGPPCPCTSTHYIQAIADCYMTSTSNVTITGASSATVVIGLTTYYVTWMLDPYGADDCISKMFIKDNTQLEVRCEMPLDCDF